MWSSKIMWLYSAHCPGNTMSSNTMSPSTTAPNTTSPTEWTFYCLFQWRFLKADYYRGNHLLVHPGLLHRFICVARQKMRQAAEGCCYKHVSRSCAADTTRRLHRNHHITGGVSKAIQLHSFCFLFLYKCICAYLFEEKKPHTNSWLKDMCIIVYTAVCVCHVWFRIKCLIFLCVIHYLFFNVPATSTRFS